MAVTFNSGRTLDAYQSEDPAPESVVGPDPTRSIEVWAFNPAVSEEETLVAWGRRGGPTGSNMAFNYGTDDFNGAVDHWFRDLAWDDAGGAPEAGKWHYLVYTYDGETTRVYVDGCQVNECEAVSRVLGRGVVNTHSEHHITLAVQIADAAGNLDFGSRAGSLSIARVRESSWWICERQTRPLALLYG